MTATQTKNPARGGVVSAAQRTLASRVVTIRSNTTGTMPIERPLGDGKKNISECEYTVNDKMRNIKRVRPIKYDVNGREPLDPRDASDAAHLAEVKAWLEDGTDPRISKYEVRIEEGGSEGQPIQFYDKMNAKTIVERIASDLELMGDAPDDAREYLERVARYELENKNRKGILDALEDLCVAAGVEYGTDDVVEED
jgi:hypothetical protein